MSFHRVLLSVLCLHIVLWTCGAAAYDLPQVCIDAHTMQQAPDPDRNRIIELYTQCLQGDLGPKNRAVALLNRGNDKYRLGDWDGARADFDASIAAYPLARAHNSRGVVKKRQDDIPGALADYAKALEIDPRYHEAYYNRGLARKSQGDIEGAVADFTRSIECNPGYAKSYGSRAFVYKELGRIEAAKADAARARELDPNVKVPTF